MVHRFLHNLFRVLQLGYLDKKFNSRVIRYSADVKLFIHGIRCHAVNGRTLKLYSLTLIYSSRFNNYVDDDNNNALEMEETNKDGDDGNDNTTFSEWEAFESWKTTFSKYTCNISGKKAMKFGDHFAKK